MSPANSHVCGPRRQGGFTLLEMMVTTTVAAVLAAIAVPGFRGLLLDSARTATVNELVIALTQARGEAQKQGRVAVVCPLDATAQTCAPAAANWSNGWLVYVNRDNASPPVFDPADQLVKRYATASAGIKASSTVPMLLFRPTPSRAGNGTVTFCDVRGPREARQVIVAPSGKIRTSAGAPSCS